MSKYFISETTYTISSDSNYKLTVQHNRLEDEVFLYIGHEAFRMEYEEAKQLAELLIKLVEES